MRTIYKRNLPRIMYKPLTKETNYGKNRNIEYWQNEYLPT